MILLLLQNKLFQSKNKSKRNLLKIIIKNQDTKDKGKKRKTKIKLRRTMIEQ